MAAVPYGTFNLQDLLAAQVPVVAFGEDNAFAAIQAALAVHNRITNEIVSQLVDTTTDQLRRYGGPSSMTMDEVDEFGIADAQKLTAGSNIGFPLRIYEVSLQWTRWALESMMTNELAIQFTAAQDADVKNIQKQIKRAIFIPTNTTFVDKLVNGLNLPVKAFLNADGQPIPLGPNGEIFNGSTHTHYLGVATGGTPLVAEVTGLIETVIEHYATGQPYLFINRAQEAVVRAMTGFQAYYDNRVTVAQTITYGNAALNPIALYNRAIGILDGAEVWTKPWIPASYMFAFMDNGMKPLVLREKANGTSGLRVMSDNEQFPLRANTMARMMGVSVWNRPNGAVLDCTTGTSTYTAPVITVT
jgi:hypothetical protein